MNLGAVDHFFETLASRAQWQGCQTPGADRRPRSPQPQPVAASAKGASSRFLRCGRSRVAQHRRGAERDEIGRAHVRTPVPNAHLVSRLLLEKNTTKRPDQTKDP